MPYQETTFEPSYKVPDLALLQDGVEYGSIGASQKLKYDEACDIAGRAALKNDFREEIKALNRVCPTGSGLARELDESISSDVFAALPEGRKGYAPDQEHDLSIRPDSAADRARRRTNSRRAREFGGRAGGRASAEGERAQDLYERADAAAFFTSSGGMTVELSNA